MHEWLQLAIGAVIIAAVFWSVYNQGRANPETTGKLGRQINQLVGKLGDLQRRVDGLATREELQKLGGELKSIEQRAASSSDLIELRGRIDRLEERIGGKTDTLEAKIDAVASSAERTEKIVGTINAILMKKGLDG